MKYSNETRTLLEIVLLATCSTLLALRVCCWTPPRCVGRQERSVYDALSDTDGLRDQLLAEWRPLFVGEEEERLLAVLADVVAGSLKALPGSRMTPEVCSRGGP